MAKGKPTSSLAEVATRAGSWAQFRQELKSWAHSLRAHGSRPALMATLTLPPETLAGRFDRGTQADALLAASARRLAARLGLTPPGWAATIGEADPDVPGPNPSIRLRRGRPPVSAAQQRATNAARQRRFQQRRRELLRRLLPEALPPPPASVPPAAFIADHQELD